MGGAFLGAILGFVCLGPVGAIIGAIIGLAGSMGGKKK